MKKKKLYDSTREAWWTKTCHANYVVQKKKVNPQMSMSTSTAVKNLMTRGCT